MATPDAFVYLWSYLVAPDERDEFVARYRPGGAWAVLFGRAPGYLSTELLQDRADPGRFVTIDRWESKDAFQHFRATFAVEFDQLDREGESLTLEEVALGEFRPNE